MKLRSQGCRGSAHYLRWGVVQVTGGSSEFMGPGQRSRVHAADPCTSDELSCVVAAHVERSELDEPAYRAGATSGH